MRTLTITLAAALTLAAPVAAETTITHSEVINVWGRTPLTAAIERAVERTELQADPAPIVTEARREGRKLNWRGLVDVGLAGIAATAVYALCKEGSALGCDGGDQPNTTNEGVDPPAQGTGETAGGTGPRDHTVLVTTGAYAAALTILTLAW